MISLNYVWPDMNKNNVIIIIQMVAYDMHRFCVPKSPRIPFINIY